MTTMPAGCFLLTGKDDDEYEEDRNHLQGCASKEFIFQVNNKEFKPGPSISALVSLGHAILLMIISQIQQK